jgi:hypothetical protein
MGSDEQERVKLTIAAHFETYKALRSEIVATLSSAYLTTNLTITGTGIMLAAAPFIYDRKLPFLFLLGSYLLIFVALTQLRYEMTVLNMSQHIIDVVAPGIRRALNALGDDSEVRQVLDWEQSGRRDNHPKINWSIVIEVSRYVMPLIAALAGLAAYLFMNLEMVNFEWWHTRLSLALSLLSFLFWCYCLFLAYRVRRQLQGDP